MQQLLSPIFVCKMSMALPKCDTVEERRNEFVEGRRTKELDPERETKRAPQHLLNTKKQELFDTEKMGKSSRLKRMIQKTNQTTK